MAADSAAEAVKLSMEAQKVVESLSGKNGGGGVKPKSN